MAKGLPGGRSTWPKASQGADPPGQSSPRGPIPLAKTPPGELQPWQATITLKALQALLPALAMLLGACGDEGLRAGQAPRLVTDPLAELTFPAVAVGDQADQILVLTNAGSGPLEVSELYLEQGRAFSLDDLVLPLTLPPGQDQAVTVRFRPTAAQAETDRLHVKSNDPEVPDHLIQVRGLPAFPDLEVLPPGGIDFGLVRVDLMSPCSGGEACDTGWTCLNGTCTRSEAMTLRNAGSAPLTLKDLALPSPTSPFFLSVTWAGELTLEPQESLTLPILFLPEAGREGEERDLIILTTDDPGEAVYPFELRAVAVMALVEVDPPTGLLDFGTLVVPDPVPSCSFDEDCGGSNQVCAGDTCGEARTVRIMSRGLAPLTLSGLHLAEESSPDFTLLDAPDLPLPLAPGEMVEVRVAYGPRDEGTDGGYLTVVTDDASHGVVLIDLYGRGVVNEPPVAVPGPDVVARPLETVTLDGGQSFDPDGTVESYAWTILERPPQSRSIPEAVSDDGAVISFFADLAGDYLFELTVTDDRGARNENEARLRLEVVPASDMHVQMVWVDETKDNNDLDLHLARPNGCWFTAMDCYYENCRPPRVLDWGLLGSGEDDPSLDIDCIEGCVGPENINLDPSEPGFYHVGVDYYADQGHGPCPVIVRIYLGGSLVAEFGPRLMERTKDFWYVATVEWPTGLVRAVDGYTGHGPEGPSPGCF